MVGKQEYLPVTSMLVPSVQELVKDPLSTIPSKYVQPNPDNSTSCDDLQLPVIDMDCLVAGDPIELQKFHSTCQDWGFFQLVNHGMSKTLIEKFKVETQEWFNQSREEKQKYWQTPTEMEGFGQHFVVSDDQKLDWADSFFLTTLPAHLRKPNLFSIIPLPYRETLENYSRELETLARKILDYMAKALNMDVNDMRKAFGDGKQSMRMNYYPPCPWPDQVVGVTPHSDAVGLTILLQLNQIQGLQIRKDEKWISVQPLPDAFVVNVGDILEIVTNGIYPSVEHRAMVNPEIARISVAAFYSPVVDMEFGPAPSLVTPQTPARFRRINSSEYFSGLFARKRLGKAYIDELRI